MTDPTTSEATHPTLVVTGGPLDGSTFVILPQNRPLDAGSGVRLRHPDPPRQRGADPRRARPRPPRLAALGRGQRDRHLRERREDRGPPDPERRRPDLPGATRIEEQRQASRPHSRLVVRARGRGRRRRGRGGCGRGPARVDQARGGVWARGRAREACTAPTPASAIGAASAAARALGGSCATASSPSAARAGVDRAATATATAPAGRGQAPSTGVLGRAALDRGKQRGLPAPAPHSAARAARRRRRRLQRKRRPRRGYARAAPSRGSRR